MFKRITSYSIYLEVENISKPNAYGITRSVVVFARYGVPDTLVTDNGPQFHSEEFINYTQIYIGLYMQQNTLNIKNKNKKQKKSKK